MRLNSMLATVLIFLCSLVISSCSNDELAPISLKNRETANIKLNYPNNQTYSFPLQGGDGNYEISCDKPEIIETKMISSCDISIKALALGEAIITVRDQSGNTLDIHVIVDYYTDNYIVSKQDILLTGDLKDSESISYNTSKDRRRIQIYLHGCRNCKRQSTGLSRKVWRQGYRR